MNIHPMIVHFPIAMLIIWSLLTVIRIDRWLPKFSWTEIKLVMLVIGVAGAFASLGTGEQAEHLVGESPLVELHASVAVVTTWLYVVLLISSLITTWNAISFKLPEKLTALIVRIVVQLNKVSLVRMIARLVTSRMIVGLLVIVSFVGLVLTGVLGGAIAYGPDADPLARPVLVFFGLEEVR